jgi:hypothetical protein
LQLERNQRISVPGLRDVIVPILATNSSKERFVIGIHGPLTPDEPADPGLRELKEFSPATPRDPRRRVGRSQELASGHGNSNRPAGVSACLPTRPSGRLSHRAHGLHRQWK